MLQDSLQRLSQQFSQKLHLNLFLGVCQGNVQEIHLWIPPKGSPVLSGILAKIPSKICFFSQKFLQWFSKEFQQEFFFASAGFPSETSPVIRVYLSFQKSYKISSRGISTRSFKEPSRKISRHLSKIFEGFLQEFLQRFHQTLFSNILGVPPGIPIYFSFELLLELLQKLLMIFPLGFKEVS